MAGLKAARARGRKGGRKPVVTPEKAKIIKEMYDSREYTLEQIAKTVGVSRMSIYRSIAKSNQQATKIAA